jgi:chemotaxis protein MotB
MIRRRRPHPRTNHERWLVSYADFITLLFAFFVVLYASAQVDQRKIGKLAVAIQSAFQDLGVFSSATTPASFNDPIPFTTVRVIAGVAPKPEAGRTVAPQEELTAEDEANLGVLQAELQQALQHEIRDHSVTVHRETEGLVISLREFGFFDSGSAAIRTSALPAVDRIASILAVRTCHLRIEGHTDNVPIHNAQIASNWELSTARSTELVRLLIVRYRFAPERLSAAGYAEYHPISSNDTAQGRAQNRRVDMVILNRHIVGVVDSAPAAKPSSPAP